jgi:hypothetical protein
MDDYDALFSEISPLLFGKVCEVSLFRENRELFEIGAVLGRAG